MSVRASFDSWKSITNCLPMIEVSDSEYSQKATQGGQRKEGRGLGRERKISR
jgi:hypothetical protein